MSEGLDKNITKETQINLSNKRRMTLDEGILIVLFVLNIVCNDAENTRSPTRKAKQYSAFKVSTCFRTWCTNNDSFSFVIYLAGRDILHSHNIFLQIFPESSLDL